MTVKRITFLQELLRLLGLEERLGLSWISSAEAQKFVSVVRDFTEKIRSLGPNPLSAILESKKAVPAGFSNWDSHKENSYDRQSQSMA
jgi:F420-non-reducing hydrogenase iron-sulfur subunit